MLAGAPVAAQAQDNKGGNISLDMEQVDVREALRALFKSMNLSYAVAPEVQGLVTVNLHNVPLETALQNVLKQVKATYRVVGGVYEIVNREDPVFTKTDEPPLTPTQTKQRRRIRINSADPMFLSKLLNGGTDFTLAPEISTVIKTPQSGNGGNGGFGNNNFGGGNTGGSGGNFNSGNNGGFNSGNRGGNNRGGGSGPGRGG
jgi:hypothetical protein